MLSRMKKLVLIRHSKTLFEPEIPNVQWILSDTGQELAGLLALHGLVKGLGVLYASDQTKALETAVILARPNRHIIRVMPELTELTSITKKFFENFEETVKDLHEGRIEMINGGEKIDEGRTRFNMAVEKIANETEYVENVGIVAHGNILSIFASQYEDRPSYDIHHALGMPDIAVLDWSSKTFDIKFSETQL